MAVLYGDAGNIAANDALFTNDAGSTWYGGEGNDTLYSLSGSGHFYGGAGNDFLQNENYSASNIMEGGAGNDVLRPFGGGLAYGGDGSDRLEGGAIDDHLYGGDGNDNGDVSITAGTGAANYSITRTGGLLGLAGNDYLDGGDGNDDLDGGSGDDQIYGGAGTDRILGDIGRDVMWGGAGSDVFEFTALDHSAKGAQRDVVRDFDRTDGDAIDLATIDARAGTPVDDPFKFIGKKGFHDKPGELRCNKGIVAGDVNGDGKPDFEIKVAGLTKMSADDFLI